MNVFSEMASTLKNSEHFPQCIHVSGPHSPDELDREREISQVMSRDLNISNQTFICVNVMEHTSSIFSRLKLNDFVFNHAILIAFVTFNLHRIKKTFGNSQCLCVVCMCVYFCVSVKAK